MGSRTGSKVEQAMAESARRLHAEERMKGNSALAWIVKEHPENVVAWLWLSRCLSASQEKARRLSPASVRRSR